MLKKLTKTGNSYTLVISKEMREHLQVQDAVEVEYREDSIVLRRPPAAPAGVPAVRELGVPYRKAGSRRGKVLERILGDADAEYGRALRKLAE